MFSSAKLLVNARRRHSMSEVELGDLDRGALLVFLQSLHPRFCSMEVRTMRRFVVFVIPLLALVLIVPAAGAQDASPVAGGVAGGSVLAALGYPDLVVSSDGTTSDLPATLAAGRYHVVLHNTNKDNIVHLDFYTPPAGTTPEDAIAFYAAATSGESLPDLFYKLTIPGGLVSPPNGTSEALIDLSPGDWYAGIQIESQTQGSQRGQAQALSVTGTMPTLTDPTAAVTASLAEFEIDIPDSVGTGPQIWKITDTGSTPHFLALFMSDGSLTQENIGGNVWVVQWHADADDGHPHSVRIDAGCSQHWGGFFGPVDVDRGRSAARPVSGRVLPERPRYDAHPCLDGDVQSLPSCLTRKGEITMTRIITINRRSSSIPSAGAPARFDRRTLLKSGGALGVAGLALGLLPRSVQFASASQEATPPAMATPVLGKQADGTNIWKVTVSGEDMENRLDLQAFFPGEITINAGDSIWFAEDHPDFHTVYFPVGDQIPALFIPDPEVASPEAGAPPQMVINPEVLMPTPSLAVEGTYPVNSGLDILWDSSMPMLLTFPVPGAYDYRCIPHGAVMKATVVVQEAESELPMDQAGYDALAQEQRAALVEEGKAALAEFANATSEAQADGTTLWTAAAGAGEGQGRVMQFLPNPLEIKAGDSVKWIIQSPGEPHTVTFVGSDATAPEDIKPGKFADGRPKLSVNPQTMLPQGGTSFDGTGYMNSGYMGIPEIGLPMEFTATFTTPGEYLYYCVLHGDAKGNGMTAKLVVT